MKKFLIATSLLISATAFSAEFKAEKGSMQFPELKIEKVEDATYVALASKSGESYVFGLANDVLLAAEKGNAQLEVIGFYDHITQKKLDKELYDVSITKGALTVKPTYEDFSIIFTKQETAKILKTIKGAK
ncbi:MAG: hypothetical protein ACRCZ9_10820 [Fusobacteriaceae bacterium]